MPECPGFLHQACSHRCCCWQSPLAVAPSRQAHSGLGIRTAVSTTTTAFAMLPLMLHYSITFRHSRHNPRKTRTLETSAQPTRSSSPQNRRARFNRQKSRIKTCLPICFPGNLVTTRKSTSQSRPLRPPPELRLATWLSEEWHKRKHPWISLPWWSVCPFRRLCQTLTWCLSQGELPHG